MSTVIYLLSFNRLTWLRRMAEQCEGFPGADIRIVDNGSTYPPLLDWLGGCGYVVYLLSENRGKGAVWKSGLDRSATDRYVVSDPDLDLGGVPVDALEVLGEGLARWPRRRSVGLSLEWEDIPDAHWVADEVRRWERRYWQRKVDGKGGRYWQAAVDTTFAMYRRGDKPTYGNGPSLRVDRPYTARHMPWYLTADNWTDEDSYYYSTGSTWGKKAWGPHIREQLRRVGGLQ